MTDPTAHEAFAALESFVRHKQGCWGAGPSACTCGRNDAWEAAEARAIPFDYEIVWSGCCPDQECVSNDVPTLRRLIPDGSTDE
jgi:hypothetical protein